MDITLQTVRETLRTAFGRESFVASFITTVVADEACPTAGITRDGVMRYHPGFVGKHVTQPEDLFSLIVHELMHPMFGHFVYQSGELENVGADAVINAAISLLYAGPSGSGALFRRVYSPTGLEGLLRPQSDLRQSRYVQLYNRLYGNGGGAGPLTTGEVIRALQVLTPAEEGAEVVLLGSHGSDGQDDEPGTVGFPSETLSRIALDLRRGAERPDGRTGGYGSELYDVLLGVLKTHIGLRRALLDRYTTRQKLDRFRGLLARPRVGVSPIPIQPSKRDFVLLAAGVPPFHYHNMAYRAAVQERGLAIYLDVSGSVNQHLPQIIGLLNSLRRELRTVFLFSNAVVEVPFKTLLAGRVQTTYGTDFACIADHLLERGLDKAVVLTDGYARLATKRQEQLRQRGLCALTVLFGGKTDCPEFAPFGDVVQLEDVTT